jgi:hypothetical protein
MPIRQMAIAAALAAGLAAVPVSAAQAQYYPPCSPFPLFWPFCAAGAVVGTAATIVTAPFWAFTGTPPYYYGYYGHDGWPSRATRLKPAAAEPYPGERERADALLLRIFGWYGTRANTTAPALSRISHCEPFGALVGYLSFGVFVFWRCVRSASLR